MNAPEARIVGIAEIGAMLDVQPATVVQWRRRGVFDLRPAFELAIGDVWYAADVAEWARKTGRLPA